MEKAGVLKEIDCYISTNLRKQLLLLLYKNRDARRLMECEYIKDARIKTSFDLLEINVDTGKNPAFPTTEGELDSYLMRSDVMKLPTSILGYFVNDECHFTPIEREALFMDTVKEPMKEKSFAPEPPKTGTSTSEAQSPSTVVSVRLKMTDSGDLRGQIGARRKPIDNDSDVLFRNQQKLTPWRTVKYKRFMPSDAFENRIPLLYPYEDNEYSYQSSSGFSTLGLRQNEYTSSLLSSLTPTPISHGSLESVRPVTLPELIQTIMLKAHVIRFTKLVDCVRERFDRPLEVTSANVLQNVQQFAVLVRGWWVVKSELLYPSPAYSEHSTIPNTLLIRARDYIMAVFHRGEHLTRKTISSMTKLPALEATEILKMLAHKMGVNQKGHVNHWEFNSPDQDFIRRYPDVVLQQTNNWEMRIRQLCVQLKLDRLVSDGIRRKHRCSGRLSSGSESETDTEIRSLVSGVPLSGSSQGKRLASRRKRQLSLSHSATSTESHQPARKRTRTRSLSSSENTRVSSPLSGGRLLPTSNMLNGFSFPVPLSPPPVARMASPTVSCTTPIAKQPSCVDSSSSQNKVPTAILFKEEPLSPPIYTLPSSSVLPIKSEPSDQIVSITQREESEQTSDVETHSTSCSVAPVLLNFVNDKLSTHPILSLSELAKMVQHSICGSPEEARVLLRLLPHASNNDLPPPGSELERTLLKPHILDALVMADARHLNVVWPTGSFVSAEDKLFVTRIAGNECGSTSEDTCKLRDALLGLFEEMPQIRLKDLTDKVESLQIDLPKKIISSMLRRFCTYTRTRYYLQPTLLE